MDDAIILLGENLSNGYFTNKRDWYMMLQGGTCYNNGLPTVPVALCTTRNYFNWKRGKHKKKIGDFTSYMIYKLAGDGGIVYFNYNLINALCSYKKNQGRV